MNITAEAVMYTWNQYEKQFVKLTPCRGNQILSILYTKDYFKIATLTPDEEVLSSKIFTKKGKSFPGILYQYFMNTLNLHILIRWHSLSCLTEDQIQEVH